MGSYHRVPAGTTPVPPGFTSHPATAEMRVRPDESCLDGTTVFRSGTTRTKPDEGSKFRGERIALAGT